MGYVNRSCRHNASFLLHRFLCSISKLVSSSPRALCSRRRAQGAVKVGRRTNLSACSALARPYLDGSEHDGTLGAIGTTIRGELAMGRDHRAATLYSVGP
jgi:hypothetical protein